MPMQTQGANQQMMWLQADLRIPKKLLLWKPFWSLT